MTKLICPQCSYAWVNTNKAVALHAAAPDLLEALETAVREYAEDIPIELEVAFRTAIARAKGEA